MGAMVWCENTGVDACPFKAEAGAQLLPARTDAEKLRETREALALLMQWIDGHTPNFIYDPEWPETQARVKTILNETK